jgi:hypothetical protein
MGFVRNARNDHPISASTLTGMAKRSDTSCQHALFHASLAQPHTREFRSRFDVGREQDCLSAVPINGFVGTFKNFMTRLTRSVVTEPLRGLN